MSSSHISATKLAKKTIRDLLELGICDFVLSPGSRNAPLALAIYEAAERGLADLHVRIDERSAGFYALGVAKASNQYVVVICTSGTAVANYHPSALEAYHSDINVVYLTADRPARLRGTGANQTTFQDGLLSPLETIDSASPVDLSRILKGGPIHLNLQFDEPLLEEDGHDWLSGIRLVDLPEVKIMKESIDLPSSGVLIVGHDRAGFSIDEVNQFADILDWPVIAEDPLSVRDALPHASIFLADEEIRGELNSDCLVVIGRTTLSRSINAYIAAAQKLIVIDPRVEYIDTERSADLILNTFPHVVKHATPQEWDQKWIEASVAAGKALEVSHEWSEQRVISLITSELPDGACLFVGSSRPVRDIEAFGRPRSAISVFANRGLAGIDGNISTILGIASRFERSYAILGDLTFLHDLSALVNVNSDNLTIFVIDNNGGGIFSTLPQSQSKGFESIFGTPHNLNLEKIVSGFGIEARRVKNEADLLHALSSSKEGLQVVIIEVPTRDENAERLADLYQRVASAVRIGINLA